MMPHRGILRRATSGTPRGILLVLLVFLLVGSGCERQPAIAPLGPEAVILAFGDSLTYGTGAGEEESYPAVLEKKLRLRVVNAGVPGEISSEGVARLPELLEAHRPALVILLHGGNDFLRRRGAGEVTENLRQMVSLARSAGADVLLVGVPRPGVFLSAAPLYEEIAGEFGLPYDGETLSELLGDRAMKSDPIHLNTGGYARLAAALAERIEKARGR